MYKFYNYQLTYTVILLSDKIQGCRTNYTTIYLGQKISNNGGVILSFPKSGGEHVCFDYKIPPLAKLMQQKLFNPQFEINKTQISHLSPPISLYITVLPSRGNIREFSLQQSKEFCVLHCV